MATKTKRVLMYGANGNNSFCEILSAKLYKIGKLDRVVIGHSTYASPNIHNTKIITEQDYRHGKRLIFNNGKILKEITATGRITASTIKSALNSRSN